MKGRNYATRYLKCPDCEKTIPLASKWGKNRKSGHMKKLYCPFCGGIQKNFEELKEFDDVRTLADVENE